MFTASRVCEWHLCAIKSNGFTVITCLMRCNAKQFHCISLYRLLLSVDCVNWLKWRLLLATLLLDLVAACIANRRLTISNWLRDFRPEVASSATKFFLRNSGFERRKYDWCLGLVENLEHFGRATEFAGLPISSNKLANSSAQLSLAQPNSTQLNPTQFNSAQLNSTLTN